MSKKRKANPASSGSMPVEASPESEEKGGSPPLRLEWWEADSLAENPANWRRHPEKQLTALRDVLGEVGWAGACLFNQRTQRLIDGHARKKVGTGGKVPVLVGSWTEEQEKLILATLDPLSAMAEAGQEALDALVKEVSPKSQALQDMLGELASKPPKTGGDEEEIESVYAVMVKCQNEADQKVVLEELNRHDLDVKAMVVENLKRDEKASGEKVEPLDTGEVEIKRSVKVERTARVMQLEGMFDIPPTKQTEQVWRLRLALDKPWNIGLIVGPSGSGKTTVARELFGEKIISQWPWSEGRALIDDFPDGMGIAAITGLLSSVGFSSPPSWLKPYRVLSNGEQFRVNLARTLAEQPDLAVIDEFTSVVDRTVAQIGSAALAKAVRGGNRKVIAVACHYDIEEWLQPDWKLEMPAGALAWRLLRRRPEIHLRIRRVDGIWWETFRHHHYLSHSLASGAMCFLGEIAGRPAAFTAVVHQPGKHRHYWREHRIVCLPDFQGVGIGNAMSERIAAALAASGKPYRSVTSHPAMIAHRLRSPKWWCARAPSLSTASLGRTAKYKRSLASRAALRFTAAFEYLGAADPESAKALGVL